MALSIIIDTTQLQLVKQCHEQRSKNSMAWRWPDTAKRASVVSCEFGELWCEKKVQ